jgi:hypothetical protein
MNNMSRQYDILVKLYELLDIYQMPNITLEFNEDEWNVSLHSDGKLICTDFYGIGSTRSEAIDDAISRFFDHTPVINDVPLRKIISMLLQSG